jgi:hypothetical protein
MKTMIQKFMVALIGAAVLLPLTASAGFIIQNGRLVDNNRQPFVMRGVNYPFAWFTGRYPNQTQQDLTNIANIGANVVRIVLTTGTNGGVRVSGAQISNLIQWCKDRRMIAVLEVHNSMVSACRAPIFGLKAELAGDHDLIADRLQRLSHDLFGRERSIDFGRSKKVTPRSTAARMRATMSFGSGAGM